MNHNHYAQYIIVVNAESAKEYGIGRLVAEIYENSLFPITEQLKKYKEKSSICSIFDKEINGWLFYPQIIVLETQGKDKLLDLTDRLTSDGIQFNILYQDFEKKKPLCISLKPYNKGRVAPYFRKLKKLK